MSGNIGCFTGWHIPLALMAIATLVVSILLIPLVCLISLKLCLIRVTQLNLHHCITSLKLVMIGAEILLAEVF